MARKKREREDAKKEIATGSAEPKRRRLRSDTAVEKAVAPSHAPSPSVQQHQPTVMPLSPADKAIMAEIRDAFLGGTDKMQDILDATIKDGRAAYKNGTLPEQAAVALQAGMENGPPNATVEKKISDMAEQQRQRRITETVNSLMNRPSLMPSSNGIGYADFMQYVSDTTGRQEPNEINEDMMQKTRDGGGGDADNGGSDKGGCELIGNAKQRLDNGQPEYVISFCSNPHFYDNDTADGWGRHSGDTDVGGTDENAKQQTGRKCGVKICFDVIELVAHIEKFRSAGGKIKSAKKRKLSKVPNIAYGILLAKHGQAWVDKYQLKPQFSNHIIQMIEMHNTLLKHETAMYELNATKRPGDGDKSAGNELPQDLYDILVPSKTTASATTTPSPQVGTGSDQSSDVIDKYLIDEFINPVIVAGIQDEALAHESVGDGVTTKPQSTGFLKSVSKIAKGVAMFAYRGLKTAWSLAKRAMTWFMTSYIGIFISRMMARVFRFLVCVFKKGLDAKKVLNNLISHTLRKQPVVRFFIQVAMCVYTESYALPSCLYSAMVDLFGPKFQAAIGQAFLSPMSMALKGMYAMWNYMSGASSSTDDPDPLDNNIPNEDTLKMRTLEEHTEMMGLRLAIRNSEYKLRVYMDSKDGFEPPITSKFANVVQRSVSALVLNSLISIFFMRDIIPYEPLIRMDESQKFKEETFLKESEILQAQLNQDKQNYEDATPDAQRDTHDWNSAAIFDTIFPPSSTTVNLIGGFAMALARCSPLILKLTVSIFGLAAVVRATAEAASMDFKSDVVDYTIGFARGLNIPYATEASRFFGLVRQYTYIGILLTMWSTSAIKDIYTVVDTAAHNAVNDDANKIKWKKVSIVQVTLMKMIWKSISFVVQILNYLSSVSDKFKPQKSFTFAMTLMHESGIWCVLTEIVKKAMAFFGWDLSPAAIGDTCCNMIDIAAWKGLGDGLSFEEGHRGSGPDSEPEIKADLETDVTKAGLFAGSKLVWNAVSLKLNKV